MHHRIWADARKRSLYLLAVRQISLDEFRARVHSTSMAFVKIIEDRGLMAFVEKYFRANAADVTGAANDENFHARRENAARFTLGQSALTTPRRKPLKRPGSGSSREHQPKPALMIALEFYVAEAALPESSVVQCGQRFALIGIVIAQAGHSFLSGSFSPVFLRLLIARTSRQTAPATIRQLISSVMKFP